MSTKTTLLLAVVFLFGTASTTLAGYEGVELGSYKPTNGAIILSQPNGLQAFARYVRSNVIAPTAAEKARFDRASLVH